MTASREWTTTRLWQALAREAAQSIKQTLLNAMPKVEAVLRSGGTAPLDFTLHDDGHAFRVAERMVDLLRGGTSTNVSDIETALLLLAAYLHDIGMVPTRPKARAHYQYLVTGDRKLLEPTEQSDLQHWLDAEWSGLQAPIETARVTPAGLNLVEQIASYYFRHKHNDWSEAWIRENLLDIDPGLYPGWIDDLVTLCRSHHEGLNELRAHRFDATARRHSWPGCQLALFGRPIARRRRAGV